MASLKGLSKENNAIVLPTAIAIVAAAGSVVLAARPPATMPAPAVI